MDKINLAKAIVSVCNLNVDYDTKVKVVTEMIIETYKEERVEKVVKESVSPIKKKYRLRKYKKYTQAENDIILKYSPKTASKMLGHNLKSIYSHKWDLLHPDKKKLLDFKRSKTHYGESFISRFGKR